MLLPHSVVPLAAYFSMRFPMIMGLIIGLLGAFFLLFLQPYLNKAKSTRQATPAELNAAAVPAISPGQAMLYVFRYPMPGDKPYAIELDGTVVASLKGSMYVRLAIPAGEHSLTIGPRGLAAMAQKPATLPFTAHEGETVLISAHPGTGGMASNQVEIVRELDQPASMNRIATMQRVEAATS